MFCVRCWHSPIFAWHQTAIEALHGAASYLKEFSRLALPTGLTCCYTNICDQQKHEMFPRINYAFSAGLKFSQDPGASVAVFFQQPIRPYRLEHSKCARLVVVGYKNISGLRNDVGTSSPIPFPSNWLGSLYCKRVWRRVFQRGIVLYNIDRIWYVLRDALD